MLTIPVQAIPSQEFQIILGNQECTIKLYWRFGRMFCDLYVGSTAVQTGAICQDCASIIQRTQSIFRGSLHFFDMLGRTPPEWQGLGARYVLLYIAEDEDMPEALRY